MQNNNSPEGLSAARLAASTFGALAGLGGLTHGIGEVLQGNVAPDGIIINSWAQGPIAEYMGGEPGMTIVPNFLVTGLLTIVVSLAVVVWSLAFVQRKRGGLVLFLLSVGMLLFGGGFGPPIIGILAGLAGSGINAAYPRWRSALRGGFRRFLAGLWPWVFGVTAVNGVLLVIGSVILVYFFALNNPDLFVGSFFFSVPSILLTILTGIAYDLHKGEPAAG